jgi:cyclic lactone autoinducer peptide
MVAVLSTILAKVGAFVATLGSSACVIVVADEPETPKSLIK